MAQPLVQITAWSYSRWGDYEKCPLMARCKIILKMKEPKNEAMERGTAVHSMAQRVVEAPKAGTLPPELSRFRKDFTELRKAKAQCEQQWTFTKEWKPTTWFGKDAWLRIMVDSQYLADGGKRLVIIDYKTGKERVEHEKQRSLYALGGFLTFPKVETISAEHWYLDHGTRTPSSFLRSGFEKLKKTWLDRTRAMLSDTRFPARPGYYCRWCHFRKDNGGPCVL